MNTQPSKSFQELKNEAVVTSYLAITKITKQIISSIPQEALRYMIEIDRKAFESIKPKIHELVSPIFYLCLRDSKMGYLIHFGYDTNRDFHVFTNQFIRAVFKLTMAQYTNVDIEDCIQTDSIITDISGLFDELQFKHPSYPCKLVKYKPSAVKRKILSVA
ncbi:hypothetical protein KXQ82_10360 [Mucilaginibacter sp. HMF5004]|uniref:hypothetical protein n=1 Tax=Mucilaginibacter rivuli TaxID=2857527 RepID=UPI001C5F2A8F|nr:hypothetical protein [Mucilaginibacter rivuli]MBW4890121.1 hypothetical protein [Mucilaginibacter rivuli]